MQNLRAGYVEVKRSDVVAAGLIKEQIIFTEINFDEIKRVRGFNITFVTSTNKKEETMALLRAIGLPIVKR